VNVALKEWESVVAALASGVQICLLRKGGIVEAARGGFHLREQKFLLFPTYEHEHLLLLKDEYKRLMRPGCAGEISIALVCTVTDIFTAPPFQALQNAGDFYIWNDTFLRKRTDYKPDLPLYCILVRASRLQPPRTIPERPSYAGCKSWVHLTEEIPVDGAIPVLSAEEYGARRNALLEALR
jgi:hypothetical protein